MRITLHIATDVTDAFSLDLHYKYIQLKNISCIPEIMVIYFHLNIFSTFLPKNSVQASQALKQ